VFGIFPSTLINLMEKTLQQIIHAVG
jgi:hypothetical protein